MSQTFRPYKHVIRDLKTDVIDMAWLEVTGVRWGQESIQVHGYVVVPGVEAAAMPVEVRGRLPFTYVLGEPLIIA